MAYVTAINPSGSPTHAGGNIVEIIGGGFDSLGYNVSGVPNCWYLNSLVFDAGDSRVTTIPCIVDANPSIAYAATVSAAERAGRSDTYIKVYAPPNPFWAFRSYYPTMDFSGPMSGRVYIGGQQDRLTGPVFTWNDAFVFLALTSIDPVQGINRGGYAFTLTGAGFNAFKTLPNPVPNVIFGSVYATDVVIVNDTMIVGTVPAASDIAGGTVDVRITEGSTGSNTSLANGYLALYGTHVKLLPHAFTYLPAQAPRLLSISPESCWATGNIKATITGNAGDFWKSTFWKTMVLFGGTQAATPTGCDFRNVWVAQNLTNVSDDGSTIVITVPPSPYRSTGNVPMAGQAFVSVNVLGSPPSIPESLSFQYVSRPPSPTVSAVSPNTGSADGGDLVTITGTGFVSGCDITFAGMSASSITFVNSTTLTCLTPAWVASLPQTVTIVVKNPDEQFGTLPDAYTYLNQKGSPEVTSDLFAWGIVGSPFAYQITATPKALTTISKYNVQGALPPGISLSSTVPPAPPGGLLDGTPTTVGTYKVGISVEATATPPATVIYPTPVTLTIAIYSVNAPVITAVEPSSFTSSSANQAVTITGTGFLPGAVALVGDGTAFATMPTPDSVSATEIQVSGWTTPAYTGLPYYITVKNPDNQSAVPVEIKIVPLGIIVAPALRYTSLDALGNPVYSIGPETTGEGNRDRAFGLGSNVEVLFYSGIDGNKLLNVQRKQLGTTSTRHGGAPNGDLVFKGILSAEVSPFMVRTSGDDKAVSHLDCSLRSNGEIAMHCYNFDPNAVAYVEDLERAYANYKVLLIKGIDGIPIPEIGSEACEG